MSLLIATTLKQSLGFVDIFAGISVSVGHDEKVGLIGPNGVGKTTLLQILAAMEKPSSGTVQVARGKSIGYLPQEAVDAFGATTNAVYAEMLSAFDHLHAIEARMRALEEKMLTDMSDAVMNEYGDLQSRFEHSGGYDFETRIKQTLDGLGFGPENDALRRIASWDTPIAHLSGGQKTRALLAKLLLQAPDLLILDEPTNHLDVDAIEWLEKTLADWPGAIIVCSHDRLFLDKSVNRIWEMRKDGIEVYRGNYSEYLTQRDERFERRLKVFTAEKERLQNDARLIKRDFDKIKAGFSDVKPTWAIGKLKRLTTDVVTIETYGAEFLVDNAWSDIAGRFHADMINIPDTFGVDEAIKRVDRMRAPQRPPRLNLKLEPVKRSGAVVLRTAALRVGYPGNALFDCEDLELRWRERAALIGPNGSGKTTFLKTALASRTLQDEAVDIGAHPPMSLPPIGGKIEIGSSLRVGYFAQAHEELDPNSTIQQELLRHTEGYGRPMSIGEQRYFLAQFMFVDDDIDKPIAGLSGGERARLALALLQLRGANFLVLDEPTNHLDITTQEVLEEVLSAFDGTILLVSHDRYLINKLAEQIWAVEEGRLRVYNGSYREYQQARRARVRSEAVAPAPVIAPKPVTVEPEAPQYKPSKNADRKKQQDLESLERRIAEHEARLAVLAADLERASAANDAVRVVDLGKQHAATQRALDELLAVWEQNA
jgi:ATP-binding cassette, subfamily F, member 3